MKRIRQLTIQNIFNKGLNLIINVVIFYILLLLTLGLARALLPFAGIFTGKFLSLDLSTAVSEILTFLVMIELFRGFVDYFKARRFRLHSMLDPAILFLVRELAVKLYAHEPISAATLLGFAAVIFTLGIIRTLAVCFSPEDEKG